MATVDRVKQPLLSFSNALVVLGAALMLVDVYLIFMVAPTDAVLGNIQRVFYFHVPMAIMSFLAFFVVFIASILYLIKRDQKWDRLAHAAAEVGVVFVTLALITGIIWARPVWGVWWTWEPRLTTTLILWLIYVAYLMIRAYAPNRTQGALYAAVVGIVGFVDVPIVYYSVQWWRSIHPSAVVGPLAESGALEPVMQGILLFSFLAFLVLFLYLVVERMALRGLEDQVRLLKFSLHRTGR
ncbi:MAG: cytochrome c biogenesis protein [Chloroflexi bacterium]|nr:cytochrome c biogenesis protein [Chloroflexota bacterium]MDA1218685.1 cytochrome c biogenesis protein [Chloroflexota bacterium]PKB57774.1 MAG: cytochrome C assembly protein [SAR202 cluster bacterium Casp-Chloro-G3]